MIKYFAVCTEFAIARIARIALRVVILFLRIRTFVLFTLLLLVLIVADRNVAVVDVVGA